MSAAFAVLALGVVAFGMVTDVAPVAEVLAVFALFALLGRLVVTLRENLGMLASSQEEALTDQLTGLGNRRGLMRSIDDRLRHPPAIGSVVLAILDLDGFKTYNDRFGHPAGDALLSRLGARLRDHVADNGAAFRIGGDEFCVLVDAPPDLAESVSAAAALALAESGEGFSVGCSFGCVVVPDEAQDATSALRTADHRLYAAKVSGRPSASRQSSDVLLRALVERSPEVADRLDGVAVLAEAIADQLGLAGEELHQVRLAAELRDIGKVAVPDAILSKPGSLTAAERAFIERHPLIGERILSAAPALSAVAPMVRATHERWDGTGYPDRLRGPAIPLGARIVFVADAFDAMTRDRPHRAGKSIDDAMDELRLAAGAQFDPRVVGALEAIVAQPVAIVA
jgi:diguanylate cyclase (GGDEF)-like protein